MSKTIWIVLIAAVVVIAGTGFLAIGLNVTASGNDRTASDTASDGLLTEAAVKQLALDRAGISESELTHLRVSFDRENGRAVYEIDFRTLNAEYEYELDAETGEILKQEYEPLCFPEQVDSGESQSSDPTVSGDAPVAAPTLLSEEEARRIALEDAALQESEVVSFELERERDSGRFKYEIEFRTSDAKYEYTLDAQTGEILKAKRKDTAVTVTDYCLTEAEAKAIALAHAGVSDAEISKYKAEPDRDGDRLEYEIEFRVGDTEYEYTLDAQTGEILSYQSKGAVSGGTVSGSYLREAEIKAIVIAHAGVSDAEISKYKIELDRDGDRLEYEVEFRVGDTEYEYTLDAQTGKILEFEIDR